MVMAKEEIKIRYKIENIVASAELNIQIDLFRIAREQRNVEYEPEQFPGAILKLKEPRASLLLFKNGKLICTGTKSEADVKKALEAAVKILSKYRIPEKK
jgi:transcription initiation factor TFIID TATA-box-binding protein